MTVRFSETTFTNTRVDLDGTDYFGCFFNNCVMVYSAEGPVTLSRCSFNECVWELNGSAARTVDFLRSIKQDFGSHGDRIVDGLLGLT